VKFYKMHGAGNDYVVLDGHSQDVRRPGSLAESMCARRFGVGSDGLILLLPSRRADVRMRMLNPDGSEAEMCGNGIRCLGKLANDLGYVKGDPFTVQTKAGTKRLRLLKRHGNVADLEVGMGEPVLEPARIPVRVEGSTCLGHQLSVDGQDLTVNCVSMGNPHCVVFLDDLGFDGDPAGFPVAKVGPAVEHHRLFPQRTNAEFVQVVSPDLVVVRTWERGAGETLACGTGASATVVAGVLTGRLARSVTVRVLGGDLRVRWPEGEEVFLSGPAQTVFEGEWPGAR
jgi:diaminopimelate epimerase